MKVIHISEVFNRKSIEERGICPGKIKLPHHLSLFREENLCTVDDKILYTWESCDQDTKFVKDMVFCKAYIQPRNELPYDTDFSKLVDKFMGEHRSMTYDIYEVVVPDEKNNFYHAQVAETGIYHSCFGLPDEFAHDDKSLHLFKEAQKGVRIVGQAEFEYAKGEYRVKVK